MRSGIIGRLNLKELTIGAPHPEYSWRRVESDRESSANLLRKALGLTPLSILLLAMDILFIALGIWVSGVMRLVLPYGLEIDAASVSLPWVVYIMAGVCWIFALTTWGAYDQERILRWFQETGRVVAGAGTGTILMAGLLYFSFRDISRLQFAYFFFLSLGLVLTGRAALRLYYRAVGKLRPGWSNRVLIVGAGELGQQAAQVLIDQSRWGYSLAGFLDDDHAKTGDALLGHSVLGSVDQVSEIAISLSVDEVWICLPGRSYERIQWVVTQLERAPVRIKIAPDFFSMALVRARSEIVGGIPLIGLREPLIEGPARIIKRAFDIVVASLFLLIFGIPMILVAIAIRQSSSGPALFRQQRLGENGRLFDLYKFRTMLVNAESLQDQVSVETAAGDVLHKHAADPRVTRIGQFLRRYSLDELPQLMNVLKGEMSLVGPRPEMPWLVDRYASWQRKRFAVPQGITGWWQINGRSEKPMHMNTEDDLYYVYNYSLWLDLLILLRTPLAVIRGEGAF